MNVETDRLILRSITEDDESDYFAIFGNPNICKYDDFPPSSEEETKTDLARILSNYATQADQQEFAVELKSERKVVGVLFYRIERPCVFIGYHFNEAHHGKGYASEAVRAYLPWLRENLHLEIRSAVDPQNTPSIRILEKMGFHFHHQRAVERSSNGRESEWIYSLNNTPSKST